MMLDNSTYNKTKLLYELSKIIWFIDKHALKDAQDAGDRECAELLNQIKKEAEKNIEKLKVAMCIISQ